MDQQKSTSAYKHILLPRTTNHRHNTYTYNHSANNQPPPLPHNGHHTKYEAHTVRTRTLTHTPSSYTHAHTHTPLHLSYNQQTISLSYSHLPIIQPTDHLHTISHYIYHITTYHYILQIIHYIIYISTTHITIYDYHHISHCHCIRRIEISNSITHSNHTHPNTYYTTFKHTSTTYIQPKHA